jgi:hypothetical protein
MRTVEKDKSKATTRDMRIAVRIKSMLGNAELG